MTNPIPTCPVCGVEPINERHACAVREPAKPERQASEIEKRAAFIEVYDYAKSIGAI